jgi:hypothetical protein
MLHDVLGGFRYQPDFLIGIGLSLLTGFIIGAERESFQHRLIQTLHQELQLRL